MHIYFKETQKHFWRVGSTCCTRQINQLTRVFIYTTTVPVPNIYEKCCICNKKISNGLTTSTSCSTCNNSTLLVYRAHLLVQERIDNKFIKLKFIYIDLLYVKGRKNLPSFTKIKILVCTFLLPVDVYILTIMTKMDFTCIYRKEETKKYLLAEENHIQNFA